MEDLRIEDLNNTIRRFAEYHAMYKSWMNRVKEQIRYYTDYDVYICFDDNRGWCVYTEEYGFDHIVRLPDLVEYLKKNGIITLDEHKRISLKTNMFIEDASR